MIIIGVNNIYCFPHSQTVNIPHAYDDPRFESSVDENTSFKHKSILCMAIKNSLGQIIGVIQLINKFDDLVTFFSFSLRSVSLKCHPRRRIDFHQER